MTALVQLQRDFQQHVLHNGGNEFADRAVVGSAAAASAMRVEVYTFAYRARLVEVLGNDFLGLRALIGDAAFNELGRAYVEATPPSHYNVRWYGQQFAAFIAATAPWSDSPALAEMARLEWAMGVSFDAVDAPFAESSALEAIEPGQWPLLTLRLHESVQLLPLAYDTGTIRRAIDRAEIFSQPQLLDVAQTWVVSRRDSAVRYRMAPPDEVAALHAFADGALLAQVCEILCEWHAEDAVALRAAGLLKQWIYDHWIAELAVASDDDA